MTAADFTIAYVLLALAFIAAVILRALWIGMKYLASEDERHRKDLANAVSRCQELRRL